MGGGGARVSRIVKRAGGRGGRWDDMKAAAPAAPASLLSSSEKRGIAFEPLIAGRVGGESAAAVGEA